jgi:hypothetical protein
MTLRRVTACCLLTLSAATATAVSAVDHSTVSPGAPAGAVPSTAPPSYGGSIYGIAPDTGQYLPDTLVLAAVDDRLIRVGDFVGNYFSSWPEFRPRPDSAGRVEFLTNMINKEVMASVALLAKRQDTFEDRLVMREHTERVLSNILLQRAVIDSVRFEESDIGRIYAQMGYELHLRRLLFGDRALAERARQDLASRRITWNDAAARGAPPPAAGPQDGDMGWVKRQALDPALATAVFDLKPGEISPVLLEPAGLSVYQVVERRAVKALTYEQTRTVILEEIRRLQIVQRSERTLAILRERIGMIHDTANIAWAAPHFPQTISSGGSGGVQFELDTRLPEIDPRDTSRVLARFSGGQFTLGQFLGWYGAQSPFTRPSANTAEALRHQVDVAVLEPAMASLARERGLERDPLAVAMIEKRREQMMVEHLYQDSVLSRVWIPPQERRKYYQEHLAGYITYPRVRYAHFHAGSQTEADSLAARLRAGVEAEAILREDSLAGRKRAEINWRSQEDHGSPYQKFLFEELRPGQVSVQGPDEERHYAVLQSITFDPGRQLSYQESEAMIDESLQNIAAEKLLAAFLKRHKKTMRLRAHPELVMRVRLVDPTL